MKITDIVAIRAGFFKNSGVINGFFALLIYTKNNSKVTTVEIAQKAFISVKNMVIAPANAPIKRNPSQSIFAPSACSSGKFLANSE